MTPALTEGQVERTEPTKEESDKETSIHPLYLIQHMEDSTPTQIKRMGDLESYQRT
jgi:hypothetical protein